MTTHLVLYDEPGRRKAFAICGAYVDRRREHSPTPSCPDCQRLKAERDRFTLNDNDTATIGGAQ